MLSKFLVRNIKISDTLLLQQDLKITKIMDDNIPDRNDSF